MTDRRFLDERAPSRAAQCSAGRWTLAALVVTVVHVGAAWLVLAWPRADVLPNESPPAVTIDLAPLAAAPVALPQEAAPEPLEPVAQPESVSEPPPATAEAQPETVALETSVVGEASSDPTPPLPQPRKFPVQPTKAKPEAAHLASPKAKPQPVKKLTPKRHEAARQTPVAPDRSRERRPTARAGSPADRSDAAAAPTAGASFAMSVSPAIWKSELMAHLNRYKRFPASARGTIGTASVAFTVTRTGQVLSARMIGSSGDPALDAEAISLPKRASPVPAPPPSLGAGASLTLTVPIRFGR